MKGIVRKLKNVGMLLLIIPTMVFLYYTFVPQYYYRDHEGYLAGAIVLAGYISFVILVNLTKEWVLTRCDEGKDKVYVLSILTVLFTGICVRTLLFYYSKIYVLLLGLFWILVFLHLLLTQLLIRLNKTVNISYIQMICAAGIATLAATIIRGMYLFRWQVLLSGVIILGLAVCYSIDKSEYFPYDFVGWKKDIRSRFKDNLKISIIVVISLVILYLLLGPLEIYVGNMLSFSFGYKTFMPLCLLIGMVTVLCVPVCISLLTKKTFKLAMILISCFSVLSYIQYLFMNTKLMEEDGARLRLYTMGDYPMINLILWIVIAIVFIVITYLIKDKWKIVVGGACAFISAMQMVAVISLVITCINSPAPRYYQLTGEKMFTVAKEENVIVLVPDSFARKYWDELLEDDDSYKDILKDFTYYDNQDSEYYPTFPSFIHFVTGHERDDGEYPSYSMQRAKWQQEAWNSETCINFFDSIKRAGYKVYINIPSACDLLGSYDDVSKYVENAEYAESNVEKQKLLKMLFSMSIYRCVPYVLKRPFEYFSWDFAELERYNDKKAAYKNEDFYAEACNGITVDETVDKAIHIINWHGFHEEYTNNEFCNAVSEDRLPEITQLQNEKGVLLCVKTYLDKLKEIGRYDDTTIIVMGDHGKLYDGCVFIKMPGEEFDELRVDSKPRTYSGFQRTILDMIDAPDKEKFTESWIDK